MSASGPAAMPIAHLAPETTAVAHTTLQVDALGALMDRVQRGDRIAYVRLLQTVIPVIRRLAWRRRDAVGEIEDVVQDVLIHLHEIRHTYDPARPFVPWLVAIARRRIIDACRRRRRVAIHEVPLPEDDETFAAIATYQIGERALDGRTLARAVATLPPMQRAAIELVKLRDLTLKEAAAKSGVSVGALKVSAHRALVALRRIMAQPKDETEP